MNFRQLKLLRTMLQLGSVSETGKALYISQPAVSKSLSQIEADLGMTLFHRANGRLIATPQAQALLPDLERIVGDIATLHHLAETMRDGQVGYISVAATPTLASTLLPAAIASFARHHPNVRFKLVAGSTAATVSRVAHNEAEVGIAQPSSGDASVRTMDLCQRPVMCVVNKAHKLSRVRQIKPGDLATERLISFGADTPTGAQVADMFRREGANYRLAVETNQSVVACALVSSGLGVAIVDSFMTLEKSFPNIVYKAFRPTIELHVQIMTSSSRPLSPLAAAFCKELTLIAAPLTKTRCAEISVDGFAVPPYSKVIRA
jgi:DNA-binding transcriptional LysR family regulator